MLPCVSKITSKPQKTKIPAIFWRLKRHISININCYSCRCTKFCNEFQGANTGALLCSARGETVSAVTGSAGKQHREGRAGQGRPRGSLGAGGSRERVNAELQKWGFSPSPSGGRFSQPSATNTRPAQVSFILPASLSY